MVQGGSLVRFCQTLVFFSSWVQLVHARLEKKATYYGDQVLQVIPNSEETVKFLDDMFHNNSFKLDFWTYPKKPGIPVDIHVPHSSMREFKHLLNKKKISFHAKITNLQRVINAERMRFRSVPFYGAFRSYSQIVHELTRLARLNETLAKVFSFGKTYENRTMYGIKISSDVAMTNKSVIFINCGLHAREWIGVSTCVYVARELIIGYKTNSSVKDLVDKREWIIVPVVNADGYDYTHTTQRLWRKNRRPSGEECVGTDLNRNFNFKWATVGAHHGRPCSDIYPGLRPFSEPETRNLAKYMYSIRNRIKAYVDFHSYGQLWMSPWGFTRYYPPTYPNNFAAMFKIRKAIYETNRTLFYIGPAAVVIYYTSGDATDWVYGVLGVTHSYGVELQPSIFTENGFILPPTYIEPVGRETFAGLKALANYLS